MRRICPVLYLCVFAVWVPGALSSPEVAGPRRVADRAGQPALAQLFRERRPTPCVQAGEPPPPRPTIRDRNWQVPGLSGDDDLTGLCLLAPRLPAADPLL